MKSNLELYIKKLENDLENEFYDLFLEHIKIVHTKIKRKIEKNFFLEKLYSLYDRAIKNLKQRLNKLEKDEFMINVVRKLFQRYLIKIINSYLTYRPEKQSIKNLKQKLIHNFLRDERNEITEKIPLTSQINEVRITHDTHYIKYCIENKFLKKNDLIRAKYFCKVLEFIEPDSTLISKCENIIKNKFKKYNLIYDKTFKNPKNSIIVLDSNILIKLILSKKENYIERKLTELEKDNKIFLTRENYNEIENSIKSLISYNERYRKDKDFYLAKLEKIKKYIFKNLKIKNNNLFIIRKFYEKYLLNLEEIFYLKLHTNKISKILRKLAQREYLLPEKDDLLLLSDSIEIKKLFSKEVYIYSEDIDLYLFNKEIFNKFKIKVFK